MRNVHSNKDTLKPLPQPNRVIDMYLIKSILALFKHVYRRSIYQYICQESLYSSKRSKIWVIFLMN